MFALPRCPGVNDAGKAGFSDLPASGPTRRPSLTFVRGAVMSFDLFKAFGATPTPVSTGEVYTALQARLIDGASTPVVTMEGGRYFLGLGLPAR